jgi:hypothetical protein
MNILHTDSSRTSVSSNRLVPAIATEQETVIGETSISQAIIACPEAHTSSWLFGTPHVSAERKPFEAKFVMSSSEGISVINATRESIGYFEFKAETGTATKPIVKDRPRMALAGATHLSTRTIQTWTVASAFEIAFSKTLIELRSIISGIRSGVAMKPSPEFDELLGRALALQGTPPDVDGWARQLAEDVSDFDD